MTDHATTYADISAQIQRSASEALSWASGRTSDGISDADLETVCQMRDALARLKLAAEDARDAERLPLVEAAHAVQAKWSPHLVKLKGADDILRHALRAHAKRARKGTTP